MKQSITSLAVVIFLTTAGFALRLYKIDTVSFRGDEAFTAMNWVEKPLAETLNSEIVLKDPQPPLAFALFRVWGLTFGVSEFSLRLLPALMNVIGVPVLYALGQRIGGRHVGTLAALLWAIHPLEIWHAQDARMYAGWATASAAGIWLALRALEKQRRVDWALYIVVAAAAAYLYYLELFTLLVLNVFVIFTYWGNWRLIWRWLTAQILIGLVLAPWFLQGRLLTGSGYGGTTFNFDPPRLLTWFLPSLTFGSTLPENLTALIWPLILFALLAGFIALWRQNRRAALLMGLLGAIPPLLLGLVSLRLNVFTPRYVLSSVLAYIMLFASLVTAVFRRGWYGSVYLSKAVSIMLLCGWLSISVYSLYNYFEVYDYAKAPDWRELTRYLHAHVAPDDIVIQAAADEAFTYYYANFTPFERLPANPYQSLSEIENVLETSRDQYRSLWLVANPPTGWVNAHSGQEWLDANMQIVRSIEIDALPARQYMDWRVRPDEIEPTPLGVYENIAELVGAKILTPSEANNDLIVWLYWRPLHTTENPLKIFVHLTGNTNPATGTPLWTQDDQFPQDGRTSSQTWSGIFRDVYTLPLTGVPQGEYTLLVGLYDPQTGKRILLEDGTDHVVIGTLNIMP
jgi:4-amino-4-deoxy-L-arabinose transferase-like glycosyltransferase